MSKSNPATLGPTSSDILKYEATHLTRITIPAPVGTKAGAVVAHTARPNNSFLIALTDEEDGQVVVQPHNCVIDLSFTSEAQLNVAMGGTEEYPATKQMLVYVGDPYGIVFIGDLAE